MKVETFGNASIALAALEDRARDLSPLMERIGAGAVSLVKLGFASSRSPYGVQWAALKLRQGQPLRDTGALMSSITFNATTRAVVIGPGFGPSSKGAITQQYGATITAKAGRFLAFRPRGSSRWFFAKKVVIPARPYLPTTAGGLPIDWQDMVMRETGIYLMEHA